MAGLVTGLCHLFMGLATLLCIATQRWEVLSLSEVLPWTMGVSCLLAWPTGCDGHACNAFQAAGNGDGNVAIVFMVIDLFEFFVFADNVPVTVCFFVLYSCASQMGICEMCQWWVPLGSDVAQNSS